MNQISGFFVVLLAILGPAPKDLPQQLQLKEGDTIVTIGDSITQDASSPTGYDTDLDKFFAAAYPQLKIPKVINVGISGQKAEDLVPRFQHDVVEKKPAFVTICIGINDVWHRLGQPHDPKILEAYSANVAKMVDMAQAANIKVILLTPPLIQEDPETEGNKRLAMYVEAEKKIAADKHCTVVDLHQMFLDALAKKPADQKDKWLTRDGVHMQPRGDVVFVIAILRGLGVPDEVMKNLKVEAAR